MILLLMERVPPSIATDPSAKIEPINGATSPLRAIMGLGVDVLSRCSEVSSVTSKFEKRKELVVFVAPTPKATCAMLALFDKANALSKSATLTPLTLKFAALTNPATPPTSEMVPLATMERGALEVSDKSCKRTSDASTRPIALAIACVWVPALTAIAMVSTSKASTSKLVLPETRPITPPT